MRSLQEHEGFTLIEALVAIAIAAVMLTSYQQLSGQALRAAATDRDRAAAMLAGMSRLETLVADPGSLSGGTGPLETGGTWRIETWPLGSAGPSGAKLMGVRYTAFDVRRRRLVELETMLVTEGAR